MRIAVASEGLNVSPSFGQCSSFTCYTIDRGMIVECQNTPNPRLPLRQLASMLGKQGEGGGQEEPAHSDASSGGGPDLAGLLQGLAGGQGGSPLSALSGLLNGESGQKPREEPPGDGGLAQVLAKAAPLLSGIQQDTDSTRLLRALRPMLSERRRQKLDQALKLLQFMRVLPLLKSSGLF